MTKNDLLLYIWSPPANALTLGTKSDEGLSLGGSAYPSNLLRDKLETRETNLPRRESNERESVRAVKRKT